MPAKEPRAPESFRGQGTVTRAEPATTPMRELPRKAAAAEASVATAAPESDAGESSSESETAK